MGNCVSCSSTSSNQDDSLPIEKNFTLPSPLPSWPPDGTNFAKGSINLGGLEIRQLSKFTKVWTVNEGGEGGRGATFFNPSPVPGNYFTLGSYAQPNNNPLFGWVLVGKDINNEGTLAKPVDFNLVWSSEKLSINQDGCGHLWLPIAPEGYAPVGMLITSSPEKPSIEDFRCVRLDFTDTCENDKWIWNSSGENSSNTGLSVYSLQPAVRGIDAAGVRVGTFIAVFGIGTAPPLACLKHKDFRSFSAMPGLNQIKALMKVYSPWLYLHKKEKYFPSSVQWFFKSRALLYKKDGGEPSLIDPGGSNLPKGGTNDGNYWLDLPADEKERERVKYGNLKSSKCYLHVKPMLGATFTDIAIWVFFPFNGPSRATFPPIKVIPLGKIGEHVGDWEHVTLRISNFTGELWRVYFSEHGEGTWIDASLLEFEGGYNNVVTYAALHSHALCSKRSLGNQQFGIGIRNDTSKSKYRMDTGARYEVVAAEYMGSEVVEPPWLNYMREWGPKISYKIADELAAVKNMLPSLIKKGLQSLVDLLPEELLGEEGPTGPKVKDNWIKDERLKGEGV